MDNFIRSITSASWFGFIARVLLTLMFWSSGIPKLIDFHGTIGEMTEFGLNPPVLFAIGTIAVQIGGSLLVILNRWTWLGAGALGVFTAMTIPLAHNFWAMQEPMRTSEFYVVMEHLSIIGAMMVVSWKAQDKVNAPKA
jgi:transmembrane protein